LPLALARKHAVVEELSQYLDDCYEELLGGGVTEAEAYQQTLTELNGRELLTRELQRWFDCCWIMAPTRTWPYPATGIL
jgi:hypothetical protein